MLQLIRDRAKGVFAWVIVGLIIITFALFGLSSYLTGGGGPGSVAEVNDTEITENQLLRAQRNYLERLRQFQGEQFDASLFDNARIKRQVLESLIQRELIQQHINDTGYQPGPRQVLDAIQEYDAFLEDGRFSSTRYKTLLRQQGIAAEQFERDVASDLAFEQLRNGIAGSAFVTDAELQRYLRLKYQQREIGYLVLDVAGFVDQAEVDEAAIEAFYQDNRGRFMTPEKVRLNYLELDLQQLAKQYEVSQQQVEEFYASQQDRFREGEERREVSHILIAINAERTQSEALEKAQQLYRELEQGADFAEVARAHSQDPGSASEGGDLGAIEPGVFDPDFEQAALALEEDAISEPVKTRFGYHLIKADTVVSAPVKPLAEVEDAIRQELRMRQAEQDFYEKVSDLERYSYEMPDSLQGVAEQLDLQVRQSPMLTRQGGDGLLGHPKVVNAAFSEQVLQQRRNSEVLELSDTHFVVLRVNEHQPASEKSLQEVRPQIVRLLKRQQAQQLAGEAAQSIQAELEQGTDPKTLAARYDADWQSPGLIARRAQQDGVELNETLRQAAFRMPAPQQGEPSVTTTALSSGGVAVIRLQAIREGELPAGQTLTRERQQLAAAFGVSEYNALVESLRQEADIRISDDLGDEE
ncbi:MAG: SurA N-terminal domain-containing protein [Pseudomonadota bacterium]|nr:SurA N-terminal domain-containing protein [Pseudomonadota bacterium]